MSKRRHNFGTKRFKEKSFYISCQYRAEVADTAVCTPDCARCQNKENTQTDRHTDRTSTVTLAHARRGLIRHSHHYPLAIQNSWQVQQIHPSIMVQDIHVLPFTIVYYISSSHSCYFTSKSECNQILHK